ncbi:hypothetical protein GCM10022377_10390 [Zhihengliuella alba]|uniref:DUF4258 domain-containing protein n=1 Tax=Zhihengliuella alba TaxID=547018 RepID=A0ABP7D4L5_9MICC
MRLAYVRHAEQQMRRRGITKADVSEVLTEHRRRGVSYLSKDHADRMVYEVNLEGGRLVVVTSPPVEDTSPTGEVLIITAYWR